MKPLERPVKKTPRPPAPPQRLGKFQRELLEAIVALRERAYGSALVQHMDEARARVGGNPVGQSRIYEALAAMEWRGLVAGHWAEPEKRVGGRKRKVYGLTLTALNLLRAARAADAEANPTPEENPDA